ncbi:MAG: tetratricopeptide repeat protein [Alphaproteobacteria bacterium]
MLKDTEKSVLDKEEKRLLRRVKTGKAAAQCELAIFYTNLDDHAAAFPLYEKSAAQENKQAEYQLGWCYLHGKGVKKDAAKGVYWMTRAANHGDGYAFFPLGDIVAHGKHGAKIDKVEGYKWLKLSLPGYSDSRDRSYQDDVKAKLVKLEKSMTAKEITEAKRRARQFKSVGPVVRDWAE